MLSDAANGQTVHHDALCLCWCCIDHYSAAAACGTGAAASGDSQGVCARTHTCARICVFVCVRVCVCARARMFVHVFARASAFLLAHVRVGVRACLRMCARACTCMRMCMRARERVCVFIHPKLRELAEVNTGSLYHPHTCSHVALSLSLSPSLSPHSLSLSPLSHT